MVNSISTQMLTRYLDVAALRQKVLTANIANVDTPGYKQTRTTFRDMFYQNVGSSGSGNPIQIGAGAAVGSVSTIFSGSNIETSGVPTDVAISGDGFFVVEKDGVSRYTRAGNFTTSPDGTLSTENGEYVMGTPP
jgi:flagellar hook protein FlgE